ncbi:hypothetical protein AVEN_245331-1 [Araneus ventricosus]|uniref:Uncharacterized protein n=1 Tax=Araneus ventricosus TaxID=182803 RepID=A0A4Y2TLD0_ARAVE|nr:hypothetical protein AVEN_245331-1 [Araneus ventricosus]
MLQTNRPGDQHGYVVADKFRLKDSGENCQPAALTQGTVTPKVTAAIRKSKHRFHVLYFPLFFDENSRGACAKEGFRTDAKKYSKQGHGGSYVLISFSLERFRKSAQPLLLIVH